MKYFILPSLLIADVNTIRPANTKKVKITFSFEKNTKLWIQSIIKVQLSFSLPPSPPPKSLILINGFFYAKYLFY